jgi:WD40 repeat protein
MCFIQYLPLPHLLASGSDVETVIIWDKTSRVLFKTLSGHTHSIRSVSFGSSSLLASGSLDGNVKVWNTTTRDLIQALCGFRQSKR